jgi:hypothetical protein
MHQEMEVMAAGAILALALIILAHRRAPAAESPNSTELLALQNRWHAPAELLARPLPRCVRLTHEGKVTLLRALMTLASGIAPGGVLTWLSVRDALEYRTLEREGVTTNAQILEKREEQQRGMHLTKMTLRYVTYTFLANDHAYKGVAGMRPSLYREIHPGDKIPVRYQSTNPAHNRLLLEGEGGYYASVWLATLALFACGLALAFTWLHVRPLLIQRRALVWGRPVGALVVRVSPKKRRTKVIYQFVDYAGNVVQGSVSVERIHSLALRQIITVLYDARSPRRNTLYPVVLCTTG